MKKRTLVSERLDELTLKAAKLEERGRVALAVKLYRVAAKKGDPIAQSNLATLLDDRVVPAKPKEAVYWYKRSVRLGHSAAAWNLAMHYRNRSQPRWHIHWLSRATKMGDIDAKRALRKL